METNFHRKSKRRLDYEGIATCANQEQRSVSDSLPADISENFQNDIELYSADLQLVARPISNKLQQQSLDEKSLAMSGLNSITSTPKSIKSFSDVDFVASPSAIFSKNCSSLVNISDVDEFFENLDKQIEKKLLSPKPVSKVLYVQAQISAPHNKITSESHLPTTGNVIMSEHSYFTKEATSQAVKKNISTESMVCGKEVEHLQTVKTFQVDASGTLFEDMDEIMEQVSYEGPLPLEQQITINMPVSQQEDKNRDIDQVIQLSYAEPIPPEQQITIDIPVSQHEVPKQMHPDTHNTIPKTTAHTEKSKNERTVIDSEIISNLIEKTNVKDSDQIVIITEETSSVCDQKAIEGNDIVEMVLVSDESHEQVITSEPIIANSESESLSMASDSTWNIFPLDKPDSPIKNSRKRKVEPAKWKDVKNKKSKNSGKAYISVRSNKTREAKSMGANCSCKRKCFEKLDPATRKKIFNQYWELGDHEKQWEWILRHVTSNSIKIMQLERKNNRTQTIYYKLPTGEDLSTEQIVCKKMFLQTVAISEKVVYTAIEKRNSSVLDLRGTHKNRPRKINEDTEKSVIEHIQEFPAIESHYTRKYTSKKYLSEDLNISKMYRFYKIWFAANSEYRDCIMASKHQYEMLFNTRFNMAFHVPKKDQCETCSIYKNASEEKKLELKENYDKHLQEKENVRDIKNFEKCATDSDVKTIACFDLEKVLYIPQSEVSCFYYKRKFAIYNFTIYDLMMKKGYCFLWNQHIAKRGANEVGSCLWHYINEEYKKGKMDLSLYSDACTGQNRNRFIFALYQFASKKLNVNITHRFFVTGHSQSEGDMMHSCIERAKKHQTIYTPEQMYFVVENAKVNGEKFDIKKMKQEEFLDIKKLVAQKGMNWIQDDDGCRVYWSKIREVSVKSCKPHSIFFKYGMNEPQKCITTNKVVGSRRRRNNNNNFVEVNQLHPAYFDPVPVPLPLHKDLMSLCRSGAIPERYHDFYNSLTVQEHAQMQNETNTSDENEGDS